MTWLGEDPASGILSYTEDGSYGSLTGDDGQFLKWTTDGPTFDNVSITVPGSSGNIVVADGLGSIFSSNANIDSSGTITMPGGQIVNGVITSAALYSAGQTDWLIISTAATSRTIFLPSSPSVWQYHNVKDGIGNANSKRITISGNGHAIDGRDSVVINGKYSSFSFVFNGTEWNII